MSGFNVYPVEVEEVVAELDGVAEAAVIGTDDPVTGEAVVAYVRPAPGRRTTPASSRSGSASTAPSGWPGSSSRPRCTSSTSCRTPSPARWPRAGCGRGAGAATRGCCSEPPGSSLYAKPGCHLCEDARAVVEQVCAELGESFDEVDITAGPGRRAR